MNPSLRMPAQHRAMQTNYALQQDGDQSWSVVVAHSGQPVRLAGIVQAGLPRIEAEVLLEVLTASGIPPERPSPCPVVAPTRARSWPA